MLSPAQTTAPTSASPVAAPGADRRVGSNRTLASAPPRAATLACRPPPHLRAAHFLPGPPHGRPPGCGRPAPPPPLMQALLFLLGGHYWSAVLAKLPSLILRWHRDAYYVAHS
jgi:hypothetical protein